MIQKTIFLRKDFYFFLLTKKVKTLNRFYNGMTVNKKKILENVNNKIKEIKRKALWISR